MRTSWRIWFASLLVASLVAAGCGGDDSGDGALGGQATPTESDADGAQASSTVPASTSTSVAVTETESEAGSGDDEAPAGGGTFATPPASCLELPALLANLPKSDFIVLTEDKIFECLDVDAFQSDVAFDGTLPLGPTSVVATSTQRLTDGVISAEAMLDENGVTAENLIRIGDDVWLRNDSGGWDTADLGLGYLFSESGEVRLSMSGALYALSVYGGGAESLGEVELNGRTVEAWEADAANIAAYVNSLGFAPVPVGVTDGFVRIWTTPDGLIVKLEGEIRAADVTLAGLPVDQVDPVSLGLPEDALDIVPDYSLSYELFAFDHDIEITVPDAG